MSSIVPFTGSRDTSRRGGQSYLENVLTLWVLLQIKHWGPEGEGKDEGLQPGDVLASNHPQLAGWDRS